MVLFIVSQLKLIYLTGISGQTAVLSFELTVSVCVFHFSQKKHKQCWLGSSESHWVLVPSSIDKLKTGE